MKRTLLSIILIIAVSFSGCFESDNPNEKDIAVIESLSSSISSESSESDSQAAESQQFDSEKTTESSISIIEESEAASTAPKKTRAEEILENMTLEEKVGQIILARYSENAVTDMSIYKFGGYTLYARDFENETPESITAELSAVATGNDIMPFFATDEEGGNITRVSRYSAFAEQRLPSVQTALLNGMTMDEWTMQMADIMNSAGINLNFAPVADVAESSSDYIYNRTAGLDYKETGELIADIITGMNSQGLMGCLKHFPGYGPNVDTHTGISVDSRSLSDFKEKDFIPFIKGIEAGAPMIMVNHNIVEAFNANVPASLAPEVHKVLRELGFEGIIITDDLGMDAIALYTDNPYITAFLAGNDMLCTSDGATTYNAIHAAVLDGRISEERLNESVLRILNAKLMYKIIE